MKVSVAVTNHLKGYSDIIRYGYIYQITSHYLNFVNSDTGLNTSAKKIVGIKWEVNSKQKNNGFTNYFTDFLKENIKKKYFKKLKRFIV